MKKPIPDYGTLMTLTEFTEDCKLGCLINYDGYGYYSDGKTMTEILIRPSDVMSGRVNQKYTHVVWFNR